MLQTAPAEGEWKGMIVDLPIVEPDAAFDVNV
jgi:hypothetical protein